VDNFSVRKAEYLNEAIQDLPNKSLVQIVEGVIRDRTICEKVTLSIDVIIHLAA